MNIKTVVKKEYQVATHQSCTMVTMVTNVTGGASATHPSSILTGWRVLRFPDTVRMT